MASKCKIHGLFLILMALMLSASAVSAQSVALEIGRLNDALPGDTLSIPVIKSSGASAINGYDLLISYDAELLNFISLSPGVTHDIPGAFEWEFIDSDATIDSFPQGYIRAVALAEINNGDHHPLSTMLPDGIVLFTLNFSIAPDAPTVCIHSQIRFGWLDCGDNSIAVDSSGISLGISERVFDWIGTGYTEITDQNHSLPTFSGAPHLCLSDTSIMRMIDFYNGGVMLNCAEPSVNRGDVNCNGIPYEVADYVFFSNYLIAGPSALGDSFECALHASDVNADGKTLMVEDLVYLFRVASGDAEPYDEIFEHTTVTATMIQNSNAGTVTLEYANELAALHLVFEGEVVPSLMFPMQAVVMGYGFDGQYTRVLIAHNISNLHPDSVNLGFFAHGEFLSYTGQGTLVIAGAGDNNDNVFDIAIEFGTGETLDPFRFEIGFVHHAALGQSVSVPIIKMAGQEGISGFNFLIGYDPTGMTVTGVSPGSPFDIPGETEWEYFTYRFDAQAGPDSLSQIGLVRVIGMADITDGGHHPITTTLTDNTELFSLECLMSSDPATNGMLIPLRFYWLECGDNAIAIGNGETLALSRHVFNFEGHDIANPYYNLPGYYGAPHYCVDGGSVNPPVRLIDFANGGVQIGEGGGGGDAMTLSLSIDSTYARPGDESIYLDVRMTNAHDTVVAIMVSLILDNPELAQFGISPTDSVSIDFEHSMISDWEFIHAQSVSGLFHDLKVVAMANALPPFNNVGIAPQENGLLFRLILHAYDNVPDIVTDTTVGIIINDNVNWTQFSDPYGNLIGYSEGGYDPQQVSFSNGLVIITHFAYGDANGDEAVNVGDAVFLINHVFKGGPPPEPLYLGEANCDGFINIGDAVFLINFVFKGGPQPNCH